MATEALKSTAITNLDAVPPIRPTAQPAAATNVFATITATTGEANGSTYQMVRVPSNAHMQALLLWLDASVTTFTADVTLYYSDNALDGTDSNAGLGAVAAHIFQTALALAAVTTPTEYYLAGNIKGSGNNYNQPLWKQAGLSNDPGGFFDIVLLTTTTSSGAAIINCKATYDCMGVYAAGE